MNCSSPGYSVHRILQARILEWVAIPFSRGSSQAKDWTQVSHIAGGFFTIWPTRKPYLSFLVCYKGYKRALDEVVQRMSSRRAPGIGASVPMELDMPCPPQHMGMFPNAELHQTSLCLLATIPYPFPFNGRCWKFQPSSHLVLLVTNHLEAI